MLSVTVFKRCTGVLYGLLFVYMCDVQDPYNTVWFSVR